MNHPVGAIQASSTHDDSSLYQPPILEVRATDGGIEITISRQGILLSAGEVLDLMGLLLEARDMCIEMQDAQSKSHLRVVSSADLNTE